MLTQDLLGKLLAGFSLDQTEAKAFLCAVITNQLTDIELSSALTAIKVRGEHIDEITGAAKALREACQYFPRPKGDLLDIVGTGGDGANTINISTMATLVAAAAGARVAKHGSKAVSSKAGASDLLLQFGVNLVMTPKHAAKCLEKLGVTFLFAPFYHTGMQHASNVRQSLKTRTLFNLLGPLINPAFPNKILLGVYDENLIKPIAKVLSSLEVEHALVVNGSGIDEIAIHAKTKAIELKNGKLTEFTIDPSELGIKRFKLEEIRGGMPAENKIIAEAILAGKGSEAQRSAVAINTGAALYLAGIAKSIKLGTKLAFDILDSQQALVLLNRFVRESQ